MVLPGSFCVSLPFGRHGVAANAKDFEEGTVTLRLAPVIGLLAALVPALAHAQTDIDQGKTPAQIFATDCATCHKAARGLANGRNSAALASFLDEHYTTNGDQAAALAAYVLGAGGGRTGAAAAQGRGQKPAEHARAPAAESRSGEHQAGEHQGGEHQARQRPAAESRESRSAITGRGHHPRPEGAPTAEPAATVTHEPATEPAATVAHEPSAAPAAEPAATEPPAKDVAPTPGAAAPQNSAAGENAPVPRDNIPD